MFGALTALPHSDKASAAYISSVAARNWFRVIRSPITLLCPVLIRNEASRSFDFEPTAAMKIRLKRAQDLETAALPEWAEVELQWAAQNEPNSYPAASALAETAARRGAYDVSIRYIKRFAPGYLTIPIEAAPERFWKLAFHCHTTRHWNQTVAREDWILTS